MSVASLKEVSRRIQAAALAAADPGKAIRGALSLHSDTLTAAGQDHALRGRLFLLAVGKASISMTRAAIDLLGSRIHRGIVVYPDGYPTGGMSDPRLAMLASAHPVPDDRGIKAAAAILETINSMTENDLCLLLLSGGGSSLLPCPLPPLTLDDMMRTTRLLLKSGADIHELNTVRRHLSAIAGGRLAACCAGTVVTLAVSDVVGDEPAVIASGPSVPDPSTFADARRVLQRHGLDEEVPRAVRVLLEDGCAGGVPESPKELPRRHSFAVIASGARAAEAAALQAKDCGFAPLILTTSLQGEAREAGRFMASVVKECRTYGRPVPAPACIIAAGETTVTVTGSGAGGRNQEIALSAAIELREMPGILLTSFATDGKEGNTDAAGAYASGRTAAAAEGLDADACLGDNDAWRFLSAAGELIVTGPTGTNVNDLTFVLVE
jgi:glycerate 2-kinase